MQRFIKILVADIADIAVIEQQSFLCTFKTSSGDIHTVNVRFQVSELQNDMKMIAFLCGEISNAAKYFSSFANVSSDNVNNLKGTFGNDKNGTWQPWNYDSRKKLPIVLKHLRKQCKNKT